jgi:hypothetical protein
MIMAKKEDTLTGKQLTKLALIGLLLWVFFLAGSAGLAFFFYAGFLRHVETGLVMVLGPLWFFAYVIVIGVYTGFFMAKLAQGRWKYPWLWGISGGVLTSLLLVRLPIMFSSLFVDVLIFSFFVPILPTLLIGLWISRKATL